MRQIPLDAIIDAAHHVYQAAVRTPLIRLDLPFASAPGPTPEVYLKLESLQPIGSFKIRGAWNAVRKLSPEQMTDGVWTVSAGNAAQGVAFAARLAGVPCSVMVMDTAPQTKLRAIEQLGATIVKATYDECWTTVEPHASPRMRGHFVHPFDDDNFIAGNATAGLEILEDLPDVDAVVAALGGGGLLSGIGSVMRAKKPGVRVYAAEPETAAPLALSLTRGEASRFDALAAVVRRRRRRQVRAADDVAAAEGARRRLDRDAARRDRVGDAQDRRARARRRRRRGRHGDRGGAERPRRHRQDRRGGLRRQHRSVTILGTRQRSRRYLKTCLKNASRRRSSSAAPPPPP